MRASLLTAAIVIIAALIDYYGYEPYRHNRYATYVNWHDPCHQNDLYSWTIPSIEQQPNPVQDDPFWHYDRGLIDWDNYHPPTDYAQMAAFVHDIEQCEDKIADTPRYRACMDAVRQKWSKQ